MTDTAYRSHSLRWLLLAAVLVLICILAGLAADAGLTDSLGLPPLFGGAR